MIMSLAEQRGTYCEDGQWMWRRPTCFSPMAAAALAALPLLLAAAGQGHVHAGHWPLADRLKVFRGPIFRASSSTCSFCPCERIGLTSTLVFSNGRETVTS